MNIEKAYRDYVEHYNYAKKQDKSVHTMSDVSFFFADNERFTEWYKAITKERYEVLEKIFYEFLPTRNIAIYTSINGVADWYYNIFTGNGFYIGYGDGSSTENFDIGKAMIVYIADSLSQRETIIGISNHRVSSISGREKIIPLTYITQKKYLNKSKKLHPQVVDWKHSWEVLGHWRKIRMIGKNRDGVYGEIGRTWVNPCIKGKGDLVTKLRVLR